MCPTYAPAVVDPNDAANNVAAMCTWTQDDVFRTTTDKDGDYEFDGLTEGYYAVWFTGGGLEAANFNADGKADDDADLDNGGTVSPSSHITSVMGRSDYSTRGNSFTVYSKRAGTADVLTSLVIKGMTAAAVTAESDTTYVLGDPVIPENQADDGTDEVTGVTEAIIFAGGTVSVTAKASTGASISITATDGTDGKARGCGGGACSISFDPTDGHADAADDEDPGETTITIRVVAGNGYNDHEYTLTSITRAEPAGNTPTSIEVGGTAVQFTNGIGNASIATDATDVEVDCRPGGRTNRVGFVWWRLAHGRRGR